jgi:hypothetical protein
LVEEMTESGWSVSVQIKGNNGEYLCVFDTGPSQVEARGASIPETVARAWLKSRQENNNVSK